ncbi:MAG: hypothetical protein ABIJ56_05425 [Pseudomonadota bacterium]
MTYEASPVGATGWESILTDPNADINDLAFAIAACRLNSLDNDIRDKVANLHIIAELQSAYRERLAYLKEMLDKSDADSDTIEVPVDAALEMDYDWGDGRVNRHHTGDMIPDDAEFYIYNEDGDRVEVEATTREQQIENALSMPDYKVFVEVDKAELEAMMSRIQGKLEDLGSDSSLELLDINRSLSRRNQVLQLASNIMSSSNQSAMGIIANIK